MICIITPMRSVSILALTVIGAAVAAGAQDPREGAILIKAARILDVAAGVYRPNQALLVSRGRIVQTGPLAEIQGRDAPGTVTIDLGSATLLPGLIDSHAHVLASMDGRLDPGANIIAAITRVGLARRVLLGVANARELLEAGFTTVRNLGHSGMDGDVALRDAIDAGSVPGPRLLAAGRKITPPGGQAVTFQRPDPEILGQEYITITGTVEAQRAVADLLTARVDVIKIVVDDEKRLMAPNEITAIVSAAHRAGIRVAAHATTAAGIQAAIEGGVDSIEHSNGATDAMLAAMRDRGIALGLTPYTVEALLDIYVSRRMSEAEKALAEKQAAALADDYAGLALRAMRARVKIAAGSDMWTSYPGKTRGQATKTMLRALMRAGMPPAVVIRAATADAADVLGWSDRIGSLESGRFADIIAVQGDPLRDIAALDTVTFVMKNGAVVTPSSR